MRFKWPCFLTATLFSILLIVAPYTATAKDSCRISVETILASRDSSGIDPRLRQHIGELQSMFNYTAYRLLSSEVLNLREGQSGRVSLPGNRQLTITPNKIHGSRADIAMQMMKKRRPVFQTQIQLLNNGSLFVGGPQYQNGNLIFKISGSY